MKYKVRKKIIQRTVQSNKREVVFPSFKSIHKIGIVCSDVCKKEFDFKSKLFTNESELVFLIFQSGSRPKNNEDEVIFSSDLNLWGLPSKKRIEKFTTEPFDILFNLTNEASDVINFVFAASVSKFKVSTNAEGRIYDLTIDQSEFNVSNFIDEIEKTIRNFNKIN